LFFDSFARENKFDPLVPENWYSMRIEKLQALKVPKKWRGEGERAGGGGRGRERRERAGEGGGERGRERDGRDKKDGSKIMMC
jgi:hypothetical protein